MGSAWGQLVLVAVVVGYEVVVVVAVAVVGEGGRGIIGAMYLLNTEFIIAYCFKPSKYTHVYMCNYVIIYI